MPPGRLRHLMRNPGLLHFVGSASGRQPFDRPMVKGPKDLGTPIEIFPHIQFCTQHGNAFPVFRNLSGTPNINLAF
jgi:hypothetical protein